MQNLENFAFDAEAGEEEDTYELEQETLEKLHEDGRARKWTRTAEIEHLVTNDS